MTPPPVPMPMPMLPERPQAPVPAGRRPMGNTGSMGRLACTIALRAGVAALALSVAVSGPRTTCPRGEPSHLR